MVFLNQLSVLKFCCEVLKLEGTLEIISLILEMRQVICKRLCDLLKVTALLSGRASLHWVSVWFSSHCGICLLALQRIKCISSFSSTPFAAIHSTIYLLKLGSPPPHKEARQRRKELRKKLLAEQEELERQMKELQAANENKQQELETVRKVGMEAGLGEGSPSHCRKHCYLT